MIENGKIVGIDSDHALPEARETLDATGLYILPGVIFVDNMTAGRGFIALAVVIFGKWHPVGALGASLLFGATEALQLRLQALGFQIPFQFLVMLPYVLTVIALAGVVGRSVPPSALTKPFIKEFR